MCIFDHSTTASIWAGHDWVVPRRVITIPGSRSEKDDASQAIMGM